MHCDFLTSIYKGSEGRATLHILAENTAISKSVCAERGDWCHCGGEVPDRRPRRQIYLQRLYKGHYREIVASLYVLGSMSSSNVNLYLQVGTHIKHFTYPAMPNSVLYNAARHHLDRWPRQPSGLLRDRTGSVHFLSCAKRTVRRIHSVIPLSAMPEVEVNGLSFDVKVEGPSSGQPVVFLHG